MTARPPPANSTAASIQACATSEISATTSPSDAPDRSPAATRSIARRRKTRRPASASRPATSAATSRRGVARERRATSRSAPASSGCATRKSAAALEIPRSRVATGSTSGSARTSRARRSSPTRESATRASSGSGASASVRPSTSGVIIGELSLAAVHRAAWRFNGALTVGAWTSDNLLPMALSDEANYVLRTVEERDIRFVRLWFTDVLGFLKSFTITSQELEGALSEGMGFDGSSIEGFSRIQESDMVALPDPATFQVIPWKSEAEVARMFCDVYEPDGTPFDGDPRHVLKRQLKRAADMGFTFYVGPELEYFYFKASDDPSFLDEGGYFAETPVDVATDCRKRTVGDLEAMGIPVEYVHH